MVANLTWLVSEGSLIFHHASTANNYNQSQWSCTRLLAVVSRADSDPDSRILHAGSPPKKITESGSIHKAERKTWPSKWQLSLRFHLLCSQWYHVKSTPFILITSDLNSCCCETKFCKKKILSSNFFVNNEWGFLPKKTSNITDMKRAYIVQLAVLLSPKLPLLDPSL